MPTVQRPSAGEPIRISGGKLQVPDHAIVPYVEGDGTGRDIWRASQRVFDAADAPPGTAPDRWRVRYIRLDRRR